MNVAALTGSVGPLPGATRGASGSATVPVAAERPQEPFLSPVFRFDKQARVLVFQFRDSETGDVTRQYPSEKVVRLYRDNAPQATPAAPPSEFGGGGSEEPAAASSASTEPAAAPPPAPVKTSGGGGDSGGGSEGTGDRVRLTA